MSRPRVYLAGPITGLAYAGAADWRTEAMHKLNVWGIDGFSPLRAKWYLKNESRIDGSPGAYQRVHPLSAPKGICTRDRNDVKEADVLLINLLGAERVSIGTMIEVGWADAYRVPIVLVIEPAEWTNQPPPGSATDTAGASPLALPNPHLHAMVDQLAGYIVHDLNSAIDIVKALVLP